MGARHSLTIGNVAHVGVVLTWGLLPLACGPVYGFLHARWTVEDTGAIYLAVGGMALVWLIVGALLSFRVARARRRKAPIFAGLLAVAVLAGLSMGPIAFDIVICAGTDDSDQPIALVHSGESVKQSVRLKAADGPAAGATFTFAKGRLDDIATRPLDPIHVTYLAHLHRGRFGIWWVSFVER